MKSFNSVFALTARIALSRILITAAAVMAAVTALFVLAVALGDTNLPLEQLWNTFQMDTAMLLGFAVMGYALATSFHSKGKSNYHYTLGKLTSKPVTTLSAVAVFHCICYLFLGALLLILFWGFSQYYTGIGRGPSGIHTTFLAFHRIAVLKNLIAGNPIWITLRNILLLCSGSVITASLALVKGGYFRENEIEETEN